MNRAKIYRCLHCGTLMQGSEPPEVCEYCGRRNWDYIPKEWKRKKENSDGGKG